MRKKIADPLLMGECNQQLQNRQDKLLIRCIQSQWEHRNVQRNDENTSFIYRPSLSWNLD